ncbi:MAG TPA: hypothetical protein VL361_08150 [Candidatus Limnocylindrales bacterium]|nr:hypothetical protein [Candidatus Limnocylindrales bacterium]
MKDREKSVSEMTDTAMKNYEQAVRTTLKLQEEAARCWSSMLNQTTLVQDWQKRLDDFSGMTNKFVPLAQQRMEEVISLMEKNSRTGAELMKKAVDAAQTPVISESQAKWMEFWTSSMGAMRTNTEAFAEIGTKAVDSWIDFVRRNTDLNQVRGTKTA